MEDVAAWAIIHERWEAPARSLKRELTRDLKRAAREKRITDPQGRKVRKMCAARIEKVDANGNRVFDVIWDFIHSMSEQHAVLSFEQRHRNIEKQCGALARDARSFNENNPHASASGIQLMFDFTSATEDAVEQQVEVIQESANPGKPR